MSEIKDRLKELRKARGLKQREVAERLGIKGNVVGSWEVGRHIPDARIYQICKEFKVNEEWLRNGVGEMDAKDPEPPKAKLGDFNDSEVMLEAVMRAYASLSPEYREVAQHVIKELSRPGADPKRVIESLDKFRRGKDDDNTTV